MQRRTPTKVRSRREQFRIDEIPTKDTPPAVNRRGQSKTPARNVHKRSPKPSLRRAVSLDFTCNANGSGYRKRSSDTLPFTRSSHSSSPERLRRLSESAHFTSHSRSPERIHIAYGRTPTLTHDPISPDHGLKHSAYLNTTSNSLVPEHQGTDSENTYVSCDSEFQDIETDHRDHSDILTVYPSYQPSSDAMTSALSGSSTSTSSDDTQTTVETKYTMKRRREGKDVNRAKEDSVTTLTDAASTHGNDTRYEIDSNGNGRSVAEEFECDTETQDVYKSIYEMWRRRRLCDVVFQVADGAESYYAHKLVLAIECDAFADRDNGAGMIECHIPKVSGDTMKDALNFFYTGKIDVTSENIDDLLEISFHLRSSKLANLCKRYLLDINMATSVRNRVVAIKHGLSDVVAHIDYYIQEHFTSLVNSEAFLNSDFQIIFDIISSEILTKPDELQLFHACASWINFDPRERLPYAVALMENIRFNAILAESIVAEVEPVTFMTTIPECKDMLYKAFRHHALFRELIHSVSHQTTSCPRPVKPTSRRKPLSEYPTTGLQWHATVPSRHENGRQNRIRSKPNASIKPRNRPAFEQGVDTLRTQATHRCTEAHARSPTHTGTRCPCHEVKAQIRNEVERMKNETRSLINRRQTESAWLRDSMPYRGAHDKSESSPHKHFTPKSILSMEKSQTSPTGSRHDNPRKIWSEHASEQNERASPSDEQKEDVQLGTKSEPTLAGQSSGAGNQTGFSPVLAGSSPFNVSVMSPPSNPPYIFAMGGVNPYFTDNENGEINISQSIQQYVPSENTWSVVAKMPQPLHHFAVTSLDDKVYVTGGHRSNTNTKTLPTRDCYAYDVKDGVWEKLAPLKTARARHVSVSLYDTIYVIGGIDCVEMSLRSVEYYNKNVGKWYFTQSMRDTRVELAAVAHRGKVVAVGGILDVDEKLLLNTVEVFDPNVGVWRSKARFPLYIAGGSMVEVHGVVYYVGGYVVQDKSCLSVDSVFRYCDEVDSWCGYQTLRVPRHAALVTSIGSLIYVVGGESSASLCHALTNVECIDVDAQDHVTGIAPTLSPAYGIAGCSVEN